MERKKGEIGFISKPGRYGGTYAHKDVAFEFASWVSVESKLYLIKEFQLLKEEVKNNLGGVSGETLPRSITGFTPM